MKCYVMKCNSLVCLLKKKLHFLFHGQMKTEILSKVNLHPMLYLANSFLVVV